MTPKEAFGEWARKMNEQDLGVRDQILWVSGYLAGTKNSQLFLDKQHEEWQQDHEFSQNNT